MSLPKVSLLSITCFFLVVSVCTDLYEMDFRLHNVSSNALMPVWIPYASTHVAEELLVFSLRLMMGLYCNSVLNLVVRLGSSRFDRMD